MSAEEETDRTVFRPSGGEAAPPSPPPAAEEGDRTVFAPSTSPPAAQEEDRTVFAPSSTTPPPGAAPTVFAPAARTSPAPPPPPSGGTQIGAGRPRSGIDVGDVLNQIYEVTRFIARGGMGEVFEGKNTGSDERVAIKVILPQFAEDPAMLDLFRKEARVLESIAHPALVRYRLHTREPTLGVFYIVTDYIDGTDAGAAIGKIEPSADELIALIRRIAGGLGAAHDQGAVHRDISPDNILFEQGRIDRARIIDFGIAKDASAGARTVIGDGFAGKLSFVAPEQLGDFSRNVGPWTDVYSLALVILALAQGKTTDLGGSYLEAIEKRRAGVDTSGAPQRLRPILDAMLRPDPAQRPQTMQAVIDLLATPAAPAGKVKPAKPAKPAKAPAATAAMADKAAAVPRPVLIGGGAAAGVALLAGVGWLAFGGGGKPAAVSSAPAPERQVAPADIAQTVAAAVRTAPCSWLDATATPGASGVTLTTRGVAGRPDEADALVYKAASATGAVSASDSSHVARLDPSFCPMLDNLRAVRADTTSHIDTAIQRYSMAVFPDGRYAGQRGIRVVLNLSLADVGAFGLYSIEKGGEIGNLLDRPTLEAKAAAQRSVYRLPGKERYRVQVDAPSPGSGWAGMFLLTGKSAWNLTESMPTDSAAFRAKAAANGWRAEMIWYQFVDDPTA